MTLTRIVRWTVLAALFLIPIIPLYIAQESFFPFITGKAFAFRILVEIALVAWIALAAMDRKYRPKFSWLLALFGGFTAWIFIADLFALNAHKALWSNFERMDGFVTLIHVFLFFLVAGTVLAADKLWRKWWLTFLTVAALMCAYSLLQLAGGIQINQGGVRVDGTFGNAIYLAVYLMFAAFIAVWQAIESKGWLRYALLALAGVSTIILFYTATRGAIVAIVAGAGFAALLWAISSNKKNRRAAIGSLAGILVLVGGFWLVRDSAFVQESPIFSRIASISLSELNVRFTLWGMAGEGIKERPLLGYGQEGYNYIFNEYYRPEMYSQEPWFDRAHSAYMDWLVAGGIPALLLFLALLGMTGYVLWRAPGLTRAERILLAAALAAYAVQALVVFDNLFSYVPLAAILAYLHGRTAWPIAYLEQLPELKRGNAEAIVIPVAGAAILFLILSVNVPNMRAAHHLVYAISALPGGPTENLAHFRDALASGTFATQEIAEQLVTQTARIVSDPAAPVSLKNDYAALARMAVEQEIERAPADVRLRVQAALLYRYLGDYPSALAHIEAAEAASPNRQLVRIEHASTLASAGDQEAAAALYRSIYENSPRFENLSAQVAAGLIMAGAQADADAILTDAFGSVVVDQEVLVAAYATTKQYDRLLPILVLQVENQPGSPSARYRLATGYALAGRIADARSTAQEAMIRFPSTVEEGRAFIASLPAAR